MNYLLDTNIISELGKGPRCYYGVASWFNDIAADQIFLSVLVTGEIRVSTMTPAMVFEPREPDSLLIRKIKMACMVHSFMENPDNLKVIRGNEIENTVTARFAIP